MLLCNVLYCGVISYLASCYICCIGKAACLWKDVWKAKYMLPVLCVWCGRKIMWFFKVYYRILVMQLLQGRKTVDNKHMLWCLWGLHNCELRWNELPAMPLCRHLVSILALPRPESDPRAVWDLWWTKWHWCWIIHCNCQPTSALYTCHWCCIIQAPHTLHMAKPRMQNMSWSQPYFYQIQL